jgi:hypothetical protein
VSELPKLSPTQWNLLGRVCRSNGGGISVYAVANSATWKALERKGLIQGKSGYQSWLVHTREGLEAWRSYSESNNSPACPEAPPASTSRSTSAGKGDQP